MIATVKSRLFFGASVSAPWQTDLPQGRIISAQMRHMTLLFLGEQDVETMLSFTSNLPRLMTTLAPCGFANHLLFFPEHDPRVVACNANWLEGGDAVMQFQRDLEKTFVDKGIVLQSARPFVPHITIARQPFDASLWLEQFAPMPFFLTGIHLYESRGNLEYRSLWESALHPPFVEIAHTADIAFKIYGETYAQLHRHAELALAFLFPPFASRFSSQLQNSIDEMIMALNDLIALLDAEMGIPLKAVSFHTKLEKSEHLLSWEMIIDV